MCNEAILREKIVQALRSLWGEKRLATLARIAVHHRQFEGWWKWELATHLWETAEATNTTVFVESNGRADITLATQKTVNGILRIDDDDGAICVPIELKTTGSWWGLSPGKIGKALAEPGKKRLHEDLCSLASGARRATPFGVVALLITDSNGCEQAIEKYIDAAMALARSARLSRAPDVLRLSTAGEGQIGAQLVWTT